MSREQGTAADKTFDDVFGKLITQGVPPEQLHAAVCKMVRWRAGFPSTLVDVDPLASCSNAHVNSVKS